MNIKSITYFAIICTFSFANSPVFSSYAHNNNKKLGGQTTLTDYFKTSPSINTEEKNKKIRERTLKHKKTLENLRTPIEYYEIQSEKKSDKRRKIDLSLSEPSQIPVESKSITIIDLTEKEFPKKIPINKYSDSQCDVEYIRGLDEHLDLLEDLIHSARVKLEVFSKTLNFLPDNIFNALKDARRRNVNIILTVQDVKSEVAYNSLEYIGVQINEDRKTHTKFVFVDDKVSVIGSFNFLDYNQDKEEYFGICDCSLKISDLDNSGFAKQIRGKIYQNMILIESNKDLPIYLLRKQLGNSSITLLPNSFQHEDFLKYMLRAAKKRVTIYSPFITSRNAEKRLKLIADEIHQGVKLVLHINPQNRKLLEWILTKTPKLKHMTEIKESIFHRKTLFVDPNMDDAYLCEGSFNWLSATQDKGSEYYKQETSVVLSGPIARDFIREEDL